MREIPLTKGQVALVDDEDFERVNQFKWCAAYGTNIQTYYAHRTTLRGGVKSTVAMHRFILDNPKDRNIDHINHDTLDNRKGNLRACTVRENCQNLRRNTSGYPGVSWHKRSQKWQVNIQINGKATYLGLFTGKEEAYAAYKRVADARIEIERAAAYGQLLQKAA